MKPIEMFVAAFLMASASASAQAIFPSMEGPKTDSLPVSPPDSSVPAPTKPGPETETRDQGKTVIRGTSRTAAVRRSAYNVNAIDVAKLKEKNVSVNEILNQSSGVAVREEGGMGSGSTISLNGMSGSQVKVFLDGLPMENMGSSMGINNFPANSIETIEIYKGVVPIHLGSDALGGAIDIRTNFRFTPFLDASYSLSSFNTHRAALGGQWIPSGSRFLVKANGFLNYSDNDYSVDVRPGDWDDGTYGPEQRLRRFHDGYRSYFLNGEAGVFHTAYADLATVGFGASADHDDVQHAVSMDRVFGKVFTESESRSVNAKYRKKDLFLSGLSASAHGSVLWSDYKAVDTVNRQYDWFGEFRPQNSAGKGEADWDKTFYESETRDIAFSAGLAYEFLESNQFALNYSLTHMNRLGGDMLNEFEHRFDKPSTVLDQVYAASFRKELFSDRWSTTVFAKLYRMTPVLRTYEYWEGKELTNTTDRTEPGYGFASTVFAAKALQFKLSYELAVRMPESGEIFGDAILQDPNVGLRPERSHNFNLGTLFGKSFAGLRVSADGKLFYRSVRDLIRQDNLGMVTRFVNQSEVLVAGTEGEFSLDWDRRVEAGVNATYQEIINKTEYDDGRPSEVYLDRLPNIPYLHGNAFAAFHWRDPLGAPGRLSASAHSRFVEEYFLKWPSQGDPGWKYIIPRQFIYGLGLAYSTPSDTYSVSVECENVTDEKAYDNFRMQKPGRSVSAKIRYSL